MTPQEELRNLLEYLFYTSPAYNSLTQMLLILPQKAKELLQMYPELMEYEEEIMQLFSLEYTEKGFIKTSYYEGVALGAYLAGLYATLFKTLANPKRRSLLLKLAGLSEEEFKEIDPLRAWIEVSLEYLATSNKDALKLLDIIVDKLAGKGLEEYVGWEEIRAGNMENIEALREILRGFRLLLYESSSAIYRKECPLLLEAYSDLRRKLKELLR
jgi:hypothetical protein